MLLCMNEVPYMLAGMAFQAADIHARLNLQFPEDCPPVNQQHILSWSCQHWSKLMSSSEPSCCIKAYATDHNICLLADMSLLPPGFELACSKVVWFMVLTYLQWASQQIRAKLRRGDSHDSGPAFSPSNRGDVHIRVSCQAESSGVMCCDCRFSPVYQTEALAS